MKRYSTVTMGPCQGKMCHGLAARVHAPASTGTTPATTGLTTARPPFQPVTLAVARRSRISPGSAGPRCTSATRRWARPGPTWATGSGRSHYGDVAAECRAVHEAAGLIDVSTLGKLDRPGRRRRRSSSTGCIPTASATCGSGACGTGRCSTTPGSSSTTAPSPASGRSASSCRRRPATSTPMDQWFGWWLAGGERRVSASPT